MKIIKRAEVKEQECECCGSILQVKPKDLKRIQSDPMFCFVNTFKCPVCGYRNTLKTDNKQYKKDSI